MCVCASAHVHLCVCLCVCIFKGNLQHSWLTCVTGKLADAFYRLWACIPSHGDQSLEQTALRPLFVFMLHKHSICGDPWCVARLDQQPETELCLGWVWQLRPTVNFCTCGASIIITGLVYRGGRGIWFEEVWCKTAGKKTQGSFLSINFYLQRAKSHPPAFSKHFSTIKGETQTDPTRAVGRNPEQSLTLEGSHLLWPILQSAHHQGKHSMCFDFGQDLISI